jgi:hypothetical protein
MVKKRVIVAILDSKASRICLSYVAAMLAFRSVEFFYVAQPSSYAVERSPDETPLAVTCEWHYIPANENGDCKNMEKLLNCFACYEQSYRPKHIFILSLYIHDTSHSQKPIMGFHQIWHAATYK